MEMAGILRIYLASDPEKLWGTTLGRSWWFFTDITVLTDSQRSVLAARSVHAVGRELGCLGAVQCWICWTGLHNDPANLTSCRELHGEVCVAPKQLQGEGGEGTTSQV